MSTARERVSAEAEERYPDSYGPRIQGRAVSSLERRAFIAGRTVTAEQVDEVAIYLANVDGLELPCVPAGNEAWDHYRHLAREAFRAAGFIVEGADDD